MDNLIIGFLLQGIPEGTAITTLAFVISRIPINLNKVLLIGTTLALCAHVVRQFPIPLGIHTISVIFLLFVILTTLNKGDAGFSFLVSLLCFLTLVIFEVVCLSLLKVVFIITPKTISDYPAVRIVLGDIHVLGLFLSAFMLKSLYIKRVTLTSEK